MKRTILLTLLLASGTAQASEWVSLGKSDDGKQAIFVDVSSVRVAGQIRRAWFKTVLAPHTVRGTGEDVDKWESDEVGQNAFDCSENTRRVEALIIYYEGGGDHTLPARMFPSPWEPVPPDTLVSVEMHFICAWKPK